MNLCIIFQLMPFTVTKIRIIFDRISIDLSLNDIRLIKLIILSDLILILIRFNDMIYESQIYDINKYMITKILIDPRDRKSENI